MVLAASAAALTAATVYDTYRARQVERKHPPRGRFVDVDGVWLHYLERGTCSGSRLSVLRLANGGPFRLTIAATGAVLGLTFFVSIR